MATLSPKVTLGSLICCLNCGGKGWTTEGYIGPKYPRICGGCNGTGMQAVKP